MATKAKFCCSLPDAYNFCSDVIAKWAKDEGKAALIAVDANGENPKHITFFDLKRAASRFANACLGLGLQKGDRILVMLPRVPEWYVAILGLIRIGVVPCPATTLLTPKDISYRVQTAGMKAAIMDPGSAEKLEAALKDTPTLTTKILALGKLPGWEDFESLLLNASEELSSKECPITRPTDPMVLFFSSGTERYPKMVLHTHDYPIGHAFSTALMGHDTKPTDLDWTLADAGWAKSFWGFLGQWAMGACVFSMDSRGKFDPELTLRVLDRFGITVLCAPPTAIRFMIREDLSRFRFGALRHIVSAGEPLNPEAMAIFKAATGLDIYDIYGQTETTEVIGNLRGLPIKPGSMGVSTLPYEVAIVDDAGTPLGKEEPGNIAIRVHPKRPIGLFKEYLGDEEAMTKAFVGDFYLTGDTGYEDEEGYFWFVGRADDVILSSGYRIGPFEVESALLEHRAIKESAVVPSPDSIRGEIVKAFVVLNEGFAPSEALMIELQEHVKKVTAPYKYPRQIEFVDELPKTISGKILRRTLRQKELQKSLKKEA
jgi:acetyl-CoA synthetase